MNKKNRSLVSSNVDILLQSELNSLILCSPAGLGKTTLIMKTMREKGFVEGEDFLYYNSLFTPLAFFQTLDEVNGLNKPKILILDDVETLLDNKEIINLLKSATWNSGNNRQVNYMTTSRKVQNTTIYFEGKIIILVNALPDKNPMFRAISDRSLFFEFQLNQAEILDIMKEEMVKKPFQGLSQEDKMKVFNFVKSNVRNDTELSFRTLIKAFNNYLYAPRCWKELTIKSL